MPVFYGHLADRAVDGDAGVVDQVVNVTVLLEDLGDHALAVLGNTNIALVDRARQPVAGELFAQSLGRVAIAGVPRGHMDARRRQSVGDGLPDATCSAGD